jgi:hypothetical protein
LAGLLGGPGKYAADIIRKRSSSPKFDLSIPHPECRTFKHQYNPEKILLVGRSGIPWPDFLRLNIADLFS